LIFTWPSADDFRAHVIEEIRIMLNGFGTLIRGRPGVRDALTKPFDFGRTTHESRGEDRGGNRSAVIGNAFHSQGFR
jgi:hypothetical protein